MYAGASDTLRLFITGWRTIFTAPSFDTQTSLWPDRMSTLRSSVHSKTSRRPGYALSGTPLVDGSRRLLQRVMPLRWTWSAQVETPANRCAMRMWMAASSLGCSPRAVVVFHASYLRPTAFHDVLIRTGRSQQLYFLEECWNSSMPHQRIGSALVASFALLSFMRSASPMSCPRRSSLTESALVPPPGTELILLIFL